MVTFNAPGNGARGDPLQVIRTYLATAIQIGAPAYNCGDHRGCYEVYACTARMLLQAVQGAEEARTKLREALEACSTVLDVNRQAWIMREAFDAHLSAVFLSDAGGRGFGILDVVAHRRRRIAVFAGFAKFRFRFIHRAAEFHQRGVGANMVGIQ